MDKSSKLVKSSCLQGHTGTEPLCRKGHTNLVSYHGQQAGTNLLEVSRVKVIQCNRRGHMKVRQFPSYTRTCPRHPRIPRNSRQQSNSYPSSPLMAHLALLASSQLSEAQHGVQQDISRCPVTSSIKENCISSVHWLQQ